MNQNESNDRWNVPNFPPDMSNGQTVIIMELRYTEERIEEIRQTEHVETTVTMGPRATMTRPGAPNASKSTTSSTSFSAGSAGAATTAASPTEPPAPSSPTAASPASTGHPTMRPKYSLVLIRNLYGQDVSCICAHFNQLLANSPLASGYLPLAEDNVYNKLEDGVLLCALANILTAGTVDDATVARGAALEGPDGQMLMIQNLSLGLMSLKTLGVCIAALDAQKIYSLGPLSITGLLLQVLRLATVDKLNLKDNEQLVYIFDNWSDKEELIGIKSVSRENMLRQWVNYQLRKGGTDLELKDFATSLADSVIYAHLLRTVAPEAKKASLRSIDDIMLLKDMVLRATFVVNNASILGISDVITPEHIAEASICSKPGSAANVQRIFILNLAFLYQIYSRYPNIDVPRQKMNPSISEELKKSYAKGASEETLLMWLNSNGPKPPVLFLDSDLCNGIALLQVWESISPGCVNWSKVDHRDTKMPKRKFVWMSNCAEVMECAKKHGIKVNCSAIDIATGEKKNTLALVFMMMRLHSQLHRKRICGSNVADLDDKGLVMWFNKQIKQYGSSFQLKGINDPGLRNTSCLGYLGERVLTEHGRGGGGAAPKTAAATTGGKCGGAGAGSSGKSCTKTAAIKSPSPTAASGLGADGSSSSSSTVAVLPVKSAADFGGGGLNKSLGMMASGADANKKKAATTTDGSKTYRTVAYLTLNSGADNGGGGKTGGSKKVPSATTDGASSSSSKAAGSAKVGSGGGGQEQTRQKGASSEEEGSVEGASKKYQYQGSGGKSSSKQSESQSQSQSQSQSKSGGTYKQQSGYSKTEHQNKTFTTGRTTSQTSSTSVTIKAERTTHTSTTSTTSISARIVRNGNSSDDEELQGGNATKAWLFDTVEPVSGNKLDKYSSTVITMFRQGGVSIFANKLGPETDVAVYWDVLFQLNALCS